MKDCNPLQVEGASSQILSQQKQPLFLKSGQPHHPFRSLVQWLITDWHTHKYFCFAVLLLVLTVISTMFYYLNFPQVELNADTPAYIDVVQGIQKHPYMLVNVGRLPGYPLFIVFVYALRSENGLMAVSIAQAVLFVLATLELYVLAIFMLKRTWLAFFIGLLVGTNLILVSYVKPIMSEGLALCLLTTLALAVASFIHTVRVRAFWLVAACLPPLLLTRPEWIYLPVPLFAYLLLVAVRRGVGRKLLTHAAVSLVLIYTILGGYIGINTYVNHYPGLTAIENFNLMGKVLQYHMEDEAPPQYASSRQELDFYVARIDRDPYHVLSYIPSLSRDNFLPAGDFARTIILHHPIEFLLKSVPFFFASLTAYYDPVRANIPGPFDGPLNWLKSLHRMLYGWNALFPVCGVVWLLLLCWRRMKSRQIVLQMGALVLLVLYAVIITTLGGYRLDDYMRVHIVFDPLLILIVWGSLLPGVQIIVEQGPDIFTRFVGHALRHRSD